MNRVKLAIGAQRFFFCAMTAAVAGSVLVIMLLLIEHIPKWKNSRMKLVWIKAALILYLVPIASVFVISSRMDFGPYNIFWFSEFWHVATSPMQKVYIFVIVAWMLGLAAGIIFRIMQYRKLKCILQGNVPIEDKKYKELVDEYKEKHKLNTVKVYQNDLICFPISVGSFRSQIVLPMKKYAEKELRMVLEHEMNHIRSHDLAWKKVGLLVTFIHWWNPFVYILLEKLILQEEIECDIRTCENNDYFTMKEYGFFLAGIEDSRDDMIFASALCKSKKDLFKRLEGMVKGKKSKRQVAVVSCLLLSMLAVVPSYAASEGIARVNEKWIAETEVAVEEKEVDYGALEKTGHVTEDEGIEEIDLTTEDGIGILSTGIDLDCTVKANTRVLYGWQDMQAGSTVNVSVKCSDSSIVYRIGIKDSLDNLRYREGSGSISHIFTISSDGEYTLYVENRSSKSMEVTGNAIYWD